MALTLHKRRHILAGGLALAGLRDAWALPPSGGLQFQVTRNGSVIGSHTLAFARGAGTLLVTIAADFRVGFGPLTFYRYRHRGVERWQDGHFQSLTTRTDDNGAQFEVHATRTAAGVAIKATGLPDRVAPTDAVPMTHWALAAVGAKLFNPETGKLLDETVQAGQQGTVRRADGRPIAAKAYSFAGEAPIKDWYDTQGSWVALDAVGKDGSKIAYRLS